MIFKKIIISILVLLTFSCGYHLRRAIDLPEQYRNLYVDGASAALKKQLKKLIKTSSAKLVSDPEKAGLVLHVIEDNMRQNVLSLSTTGKATEYEIYYILTFELLDAEGNSLMPRDTIELSRDFFDDQSGDTVLGKAAEADTIRQEIYKQAVRRLFDQARGYLRKLPSE